MCYCKINMLSCILIQYDLFDRNLSARINDNTPNNIINLSTWICVLKKVVDVRDESLQHDQSTDV